MFVLVDVVKGGCVLVDVVKGGCVLVDVVKGGCVNSVKFRGIPLNTKFIKIKILPESFFDGKMDNIPAELQFRVYKY